MVFSFSSLRRQFAIKEFHCLPWFAVPIYAYTCFEFPGFQEECIHKIATGRAILRYHIANPTAVGVLLFQDAFFSMIWQLF